MVGTIDDRSLESYNFEAGQSTALGSFLDALIDGRHKFLGNHAADDPVFKLVFLARFERIDFDPAVTILTMTTGLTDKAAFSSGMLADCLLYR